MKPHPRRRLACSLVIASVLSFAHTTQAAYTTYPAPAYIPPPVENICAPTTVQVCGESFGAYGGTLGTFQTFTMPERFAANSVTFQCISDGYHAYYKVADNTVANCTLKTCAPGHISLCGNQVIPVLAQVSVGDTVKLTIPPNLLAKNNTLPPPELSAQCDVDDGATQYEFEDEGNLSCNIFACQASQLNACGSAVLAPGPSDLGTVLQVKTNDNHPVTVECMGTEGQAPQYKVIDQNCN